MHYKAVKENDGTYTIRSSKAGLNFSEIEKAGVRGCNVHRIVNRFYREDMGYMRSKSYENQKEENA